MTFVAWLQTGLINYLIFTIPFDYGDVVGILDAVYEVCFAANCGPVYGCHC